MLGRLYSFQLIKAAIYPTASYILLHKAHSSQMPGKIGCHSHSGWKSKAQRGKLPAQGYKVGLVPTCMFFLLTCPASILNTVSPSYTYSNTVQFQHTPTNLVSTNTLAVRLSPRKGKQGLRTRPVSLS